MHAYQYYLYISPETFFQLVTLVKALYVLLKNDFFVDFGDMALCIEKTVTGDNQMANALQ